MNVWVPSLHLKEATAFLILELQSSQYQSNLLYFFIRSSIAPLTKKSKANYTCINRKRPPHNPHRFFDPSAPHKPRRKSSRSQLHDLKSKQFVIPLTETLAQLELTTSRVPKMTTYSDLKYHYVTSFQKGSGNPNQLSFSNTTSHLTIANVVQHYNYAHGGNLLHLDLENAELMTLQGHFRIPEENAAPNNRRTSSIPYSILTK
jgi:hypothetical protein